jgi:DNA-binding LytR/AlgR family response regulator
MARQLLQVEGLSLPGRLEGVSLAVAPGEVVAVGGGQGSGKSSLIRSLVGLEVAVRGEIAFDGRLFLLRPEEIRYAYAEGKGVYLMTDQGSYAVTFTLAELEERLGLEAFFRAHRGYLVNLTAVREIATWTRDSFSLVLHDGKELPLSKHRAPELPRRLGW